MRSDDRERLIHAGTKVQIDRERRAYFGNRTVDEAYELRRQAVKSGNICADCFEPLAPTASVTMVGRAYCKKLHAPRGTVGDASYLWVRVPICLSCWLIGLQLRSETRLFSWQQHVEQHERELRMVEGIIRRRCLGCGRPMRIHRSANLTFQVCSKDCERKMRNERNRAPPRPSCGDDLRRVRRAVRAQARRRGDVQQPLPAGTAPQAVVTRGCAPVIIGR
jgi:hypothetical protein